MEQQPRSSSRISRMGSHIPCIYDVKLRTVLYNEDVPPAKKERMIRTSVNSTSLSTAIRPMGFQVYPLVDVQELSVHADPVLTPKKYGKAIKPEHLPDRTDLTWTCRLL
ncbi:hypothetical protein BKA82DRAFT_31075 [Pisolithus tinctorius]|uniref:Uncharacterized protein n=1 Tax=Pisolithus tinctorius Marx 270 TaxID=870435 RepID=A0A0C3NU32_PISTI|nr:hypothetical protein BKA82DRAFT_31075 [Pisolithus tinctorius]KIN98753.1 hypothetical protein M404DRAFT_31075 [Pisolithus tinctorius Marx 270]